MNEVTSKHAESNTNSTKSGELLVVTLVSPDARIEFSAAWGGGEIAVTVTRRVGAAQDLTVTLMLRDLPELRLQVDAFHQVATRPD